MAINLYQLQYDDETSASPESGFLTYDCRATPEFLKREVAHLIRFYDDIVVDADTNDYFALLSPKFNYKTGLTAEDVKAFIHNNCGKDIYLFNPYPMHVYQYINMWEQAEKCHPDIIALTNLLFQMSGLPTDVSLHRHTVEETVYCNYWVAKKSFFDQFIPFVRKLDFTIDNSDSQIKQKFFSDANYQTPACYYCFIFERLLTTFLVLNNNIETSPYIYQENIGKYKMNKIQKKFYFTKNRMDFDRWDSGEYKEINTKLLKDFFYFLNPGFENVRIKFLRRLLISIQKKINIMRMDSYIMKKIVSYNRNKI